MVILDETYTDLSIVTLVAIIVWRIKPYFVLFPWLIIASLDGTYLSSALTKVPDGAWFTILLSCLLASIFILWRFGKEQQWFAEASDRFPTTHFVKTSPDGRLQLSEKFGNKAVSSMEGFGIFFDKAGETTPIVFSQFIRKLVTAPEVIVFFHLRPLEKPSVDPENRYSVSRLAIPNCYRLVVRHGYMDEVITPDLASLIYEKVHAHIVERALDREGEKPSATTITTTATTTTGVDMTRINATGTSPPPLSSQQPTDSPAHSNSIGAASPSPSLHTSNSSTTSSRLTALERAYNHEVLYIIGKEQMKVKLGTNLVRRFFLNAFLFIRENTRAKIASLDVDVSRVIEVGFVKDV